MQEVIIQGRTYITKPEVGGKLVEVNGKLKEIDCVDLGQGRFNMIMDGASISIEVVDWNENNPLIKVNGEVYAPVVKSETDLLLERLRMNIKAKKEIKVLKAPMPGLVLDFRVKPGDEVVEGQALVVLEAMKMENILKSPSNATVKSLHVAKGDAIDKNVILITFE